MSDGKYIGREERQKIRDEIAAHRRSVKESVDRVSGSEEERHTTDDSPQQE
jgi:hypothetical protein